MLRSSKHEKVGKQMLATFEEALILVVVVLVIASAQWRWVKKTSRK
jgi:hypothetical protein